MKVYSKCILLTGSRTVYQDTWSGHLTQGQTDLHNLPEVLALSPQELKVEYVQHGTGRSTCARSPQTHLAWPETQETEGGGYVESLSTLLLETLEESHP